MSKNKSNKNVGGKGYYIALVLCAVAIGISGYMYYRNADKTKTQLKNQEDQAVVATEDDDVPASATQPSGKTEKDTNPPATDQQIKKPVKTVAPLAGETVAKYSMEALSYNVTTRDWRVHNGIDIAAEAGTEVCAAADGTVYTVYDDETMGTTVVISHEGGYTTRYASLSQEVSVKPGDQVSAGQVIGKVGNTALLETAVGDHLHFAVLCNGEIVDPAEFFAEE